MPGQISSRRLKLEIANALAAKDWENEMESLLSYSPRRLISPLFSLLLSRDFSIKWHAVSAFGRVVSQLADSDLERARIVIRRFMWTLTDESGGIGWGSPEAMAEILACHRKLAEEYHRIALSYILELDGPDNFLEYGPLREGAYWGAARLAQAWKDLLEPFRTTLSRALSADESLQSLGYLCLAFSFLGIDSPAIQERLQALSNRKEPLCVYFNRSFRQTSLSELAHEALSAA